MVHRLNVDCFAEIAKYLDAKDIYMCMLTGKKLESLCKHDTIWSIMLLQHQKLEVNVKITPDKDAWLPLSVKDFVHLHSLHLVDRSAQSINTEMARVVGLAPTMPQNALQASTVIEYRGSVIGMGRTAVARLPLAAPMGACQFFDCGINCWAFPAMMPIQQDKCSKYQFTLGMTSIAYYEVKLTPLPSPINMHTDDESGVRPCIAVGIANNRFGLCGFMPGWDDSSYGFHSDDGQVFHAAGSGREYAEGFGMHDTIGCGIEYMPVSDPSRSCQADGYVFFTKNGRYLGRAYKIADLTQPLYPCVGIDAQMRVEFNFGTTPFAFDLATHSTECFVAACDASAGWCTRSRHATIHGITVAPPPPSAAAKEERVMDSAGKCSAAQLATMLLQALESRRQSLVGGARLLHGYSSTSPSCCVHPRHGTGADGDDIFDVDDPRRVCPVMFASETWSVVPAPWPQPFRRLSGSTTSNAESDEGEG